MLKKMRERKTHVLEVLREILVLIWYRRKTSNPKSSRTRTSMVSKKNLMGRTRPHILPNSRRRLLRRKEYGTSLVILIIQLPIAQTALTSVCKGRATKPPILSLEIPG
jgi:hypothetical protein